MTAAQSMWDSEGGATREGELQPRGSGVFRWRRLVVLVADLHIMLDCKGK